MIAHQWTISSTRPGLKQPVRAADAAAVPRKSPGQARRRDRDTQRPRYLWRWTRSPKLCRSAAPRYTRQLGRALKHEQVQEAA